MTVREAFEDLYSTLVPFNERKQESFCRVCRYHDPLGPDGNKLHDDDCPLMTLHHAINKFDEVAGVRTEPGR